MLAYLIRRLLYAIPILIGVNLLTFALFFVVNTPDDMARMQLGVKRVTPEPSRSWKANAATTSRCSSTRRGRQCGRSPTPSSSSKSVRMFAGDFGAPTTAATSPGDRTRMGPSLAIALPTFLLGLLVTISFRPAAGVLPRHAISTSGASCCAWR
jgi:peptide/nickel transport system permease protein